MSEICSNTINPVANQNNVTMAAGKSIGGIYQPTDRRDHGLICSSSTSSTS